MIYVKKIVRSVVVTVVGWDDQSKDHNTQVVVERERSFYQGVNRFVDDSATKGKNLLLKKYIKLFENRHYFAKFW